MGGVNLGSGLSLNSASNLQTNLRSVDTSNLTLVNGEIATTGTTINETATPEFPFITSEKGLIKTIGTSIYDVITGTSLKSNTDGGVIPVGTILPHAAAFGANVPNGYLLANGASRNRTKANGVTDELFSVIGTSYGAPTGDTFSLPNLTGGGMPAALYGAGQIAPVAGDFSGSQKFLTGDASSTGAILSGFGVNFIIKAESDAVNSLFNGAPDSVTRDAASDPLVSVRQVYNGTTSTGTNIELSSAGFITFNNGGDVRNGDSDGSYDRFAIPIFNY